VSPTSPKLLITVAVVATVLGVAVADLWSTATGRPLPVPLSSAITVVALAAVLVGWAEGLRRRLRAPEAIDPFIAVRSAALGMAASRAGSIILGFFTGVGVWFATDLSTPAAQQRALTCALGAFAALALTVAGLWMERLCRLPRNRQDDSGDDDVDDSDGDWVHPRERLPRLPLR
jgi:uncharacterized membrane protein